jgi:hypothetical protein
LLEVNEEVLLDGMRSMLEQAATQARNDPFGAGVALTRSDAAPRAMGVAAVERLYRRLSGDDTFLGLGAAQIDWVFGANPWGVSFMVGIGTDSPRCLHHMTGNLATDRDGDPIRLRGAVVSGPTDESLFEGGLGDPLPEMRTCPANGRDAYAALTGQGSRFVDDVRAWQSVEPAIDMTATATFALALAR